MFPALQEKLPVVAGVVEKATCTVLVFIPWLKVKERLEATEIAVESCAGDALTGDVVDIGNWLELEAA